MSASVLKNNNGTVSSFHDAEDGGVIVRHTQDVDPILSHNAALRAAGANSSANGRHVASIPVVVWQQWDKEFKRMHGVSLMKAPKDLKQGFIYKKLNDKANSKLRTWEGRL